MGASALVSLVVESDDNASLCMHASTGPRIQKCLMTAYRRTRYEGAGTAEPNSEMFDDCIGRVLGLVKMPLFLLVARSNPDWPRSHAFSLQHFASPLAIGMPGPTQDIPTWAMSFGLKRCAD